MQTIKGLPDKPSALIRLALDDLRKVERSKKYVVNMGTWHDENLNGKCEVCLAGAVMAKHGGADPADSEHPDNYTPGVQRKLEALNYFRTGSTHIALGVLRVPKSKREQCRAMYIPSYCEDGSKFKKAMRGLAKHLEERGL